MSSATFYILHGDDDLRIEEEVKKMRAAMNTDPNAALNIDEFDGATTDPGAVIGAASAFPFLAAKRLIFVKGMIGWLTRKGAGESGSRAVEYLRDELPKLPDWTRLVFVERDKLPDNSKLVKLARDHERGLERAFLVPKDSTQWIIKRAKDEYNAEIVPGAAAALASVTAGDLRRADNELVKLVSYVEDGQPITETDVEALTPYVAEANMFAMVDALAEGRGSAAAQLVRRLLDQQEDVFSLYGMIVRQFRLLLLAKDYIEGGGYPKDIAEALGVHPFVGEKLAKQSRKFDLATLEQIYFTLQDYDARMKTGRIGAELALDLLVAGLTR